MRKKQIIVVGIIALLVFLAGLMIRTTAVKIDEKNFTDARLRKIVIEQCDLNKDKRLEFWEICKTKELNINLLKNIEDYQDLEKTGIKKEHYTKKDYALDFHGIQNLSKLKKLNVYCNGGEGLTEDGKDYFTTISGMDALYKCKALEQLEFIEADIESLDLSCFPKLKKVMICQFDNLKDLNLNNPSITTLWVSQCKNLETLDLAKAKNIKNLTIEENQTLKEIVWGNEKVQRLQFGNNLSLKCLELKNVEGLKELKISSSELENIVLDNCKALESISLSKISGLKYIDLKQNTELKEFQVMECNDLTEINLLNNKKLTHLWVEDLPEDVVKANFENIKFLRFMGLESLDITKYSNLDELIVSKKTKVKKDSRQDVEISYYE